MKLVLKDIGAFVGRKISGLIELLVKNERLLWPLAIFAVAAIGSVAIWQFWSDLQDEREPITTTVRNVGLIVGGLIAILLAMWRSRVAERQADTSQQGLLYDRYQRGAEMLGSEILAVRMAGIYALQRLAEENPEEYHLQIMQLFCAFVRNPTQSGETLTHKIHETEERPILREDIQTILTAIGTRGNKAIALEKADSRFYLNLFAANLRGARMASHNFSGALLAECNLTHADLDRAKFIGVEFFGADLSSSSLVFADFSEAQMEQSNFTGAFLIHANFSGACLELGDLSKAALVETNFTDAHLAGTIFSDALMEGTNLTRSDFYLKTAYFDKDYTGHGLTQNQLDGARSERDGPPCIQNLKDPETHAPLVWRGDAVEDVPWWVNVDWGSNGSQKGP